MTVILDRLSDESMSQTTNAILYALLATAIFTPFFAIGRFAEGIPVFALLLMRFLGGFFTVIAVAKYQKMPLNGLKSSIKRYHLIRSFLGGGAGFFILQSALYMPVADATAFGLTEGLMIVILAGLLLKEKLTWQHGVSGVICALGAFIIISPHLSGANGSDRYVTGAIFALIGALCLALETVMIKVTAMKEGPLPVLAHVNFFGVIIAAGFLLIFHGPEHLFNPDLWPFIVVGPLVLAGQYLFYIAYKMTDASILGPVGYSWIIFASLLGVIAFDEAPAIATLYGSVLIVAGGIWLSRIPASTPSASSGLK